MVSSWVKDSFNLIRKVRSISTHDSRYIKDTIISELALTPEEAEVFLRIIRNGKLTLENISEMLGEDLSQDFQG